ncbi:MAG: RecQ family ATP-dependent DNA helicase [Lentimicrobiaceae bacterium]|nr:RecQ family ATP-dependent DNA helicase [Lentimicrobiaceae bacterium]
MPLRNLLLKYWGFSSFRPLQEEIIHSVMEGKDTLALMPTGGGKSLCFQIPALALEGVCIVVTPLIALMKDQVENLTKKGIKARALHSGMHHFEMEVVFNNCIYGDVKILYISPERLENDIFKEALKIMKVCLLTVDEAHCISQWGYDFRPSYLSIAAIREYLPNIPILALTATATPEVVIDIKEKLSLRNPIFFQKSFVRKNLTYVVLKEEDKLNRLLRIARWAGNTGIVYVRNRRKTNELAAFLEKNGISATFYHAGLDMKTREERQNAWTKNQKKVMVATNAFGMGIDKANVRFVVHADVPDSLEAYFQEAGRAGRDELPAYAVLMYNESDIAELTNSFELTYPPIETILKVYQALCNYFQIALGAGKDMAFPFDINQFCNNYNFQSTVVYNTLKILEREGYIIVSDAVGTPSRICFRLQKDELYRFQVENGRFEAFIKLILRSYGGVFSEFVKISETELANRGSIHKEDVIKYLHSLHKMQVIEYIPQPDSPEIIFAIERLDNQYITISQANYAQRKQAAFQRLQHVISYISSTNRCRLQILLEYFGEKNGKRCGTCDVCVERNKAELSELEMDTIIQIIKPHLKRYPMDIIQITSIVHGISEDKVLKAIQWLKENGKIYTSENNLFSWTKGNEA